MDLFSWKSHDEAWSDTANCGRFLNYVALLFAYESCSAQLLPLETIFSSVAIFIRSNCEDFLDAGKAGAEIKRRARKL